MSFNFKKLKKTSARRNFNKLFNPFSDKSPMRGFRKIRKGATYLFCSVCLLLTFGMADAEADPRPSVHPVHSAKSATPLIYQVQPGDSLRSVLDRLGVCSLWKRDRRIQELAHLNPFGMPKEGRFLYQFAIIELPVFSLPDSSHYTVNEHREVSFTRPHTPSLCSKEGRPLDGATILSYQTTKQEEKTPTMLQVEADSILNAPSKSKPLE